LAGRTPREAVDAFLEPLKEVIGCVTDEGFVARIRRAGGPYPATFQSDFAILDRARGRLPMQLELTHSYHVVASDGERGLWRVSTAGWIYKLADSRDELVAAFHWHPESSGRVTRPHVHVHGHHDAVDLHRLHLPTGRVSIESVIRFAIEDLDVVPRRSDWASVLDRHEEVFRRERSWR
jgi:hypothetical protein